MTDNLTWQVVSLELAKKLRDLGVPQESYFSWYSLPNSKQVVHKTGNVAMNWQLIASALTVAELGRMLPSGRYELVSDHIKRWALWSWEQGFSASTEADVRAKMLIFLIKNKLIDVKALTTKTDL